MPTSLVSAQTWSLDSRRRAGTTERRSGGWHRSAPPRRRAARRRCSRASLVHGYVAGDRLVVRRRRRSPARRRARRSRDRARRHRTRSAHRAGSNRRAARRFCARLGTRRRPARARRSAGKHRAAPPKVRPHLSRCAARSSTNCRPTACAAMLGSSHGSHGSCCGCGKSLPPLPSCMPLPPLVGRSPLVPEVEPASLRRFHVSGRSACSAVQIVLAARRAAEAGSAASCARIVRAHQNRPGVQTPFGAIASATCAPAPRCACSDAVASEPLSSRNSTPT